LLFALGLKIIEKFSKGEELVNFLKTKGYKLDEMQTAFLLEKDNPYYEYDLLTVLKGKIKSYYIAATDECVDIKELSDFANLSGAIVSYPYYGTSAYEEENLNKLFLKLKNLGINAINYSTELLTKEQIDRLQNLCRHNEFLEIDGYDINSPRQKFENFEFKKEEYSNLIESSWAVIGHERMANLNISNGMFTEKAISRSPKLIERQALYAQIGKNLFKPI
jgi:hypothetical protein